MLYEVLSQVKNVAQKRIENLKINLKEKELLQTLDDASNNYDSSVEILAKAVEPRGNHLGRSIAVDMIADWKAILGNEYRLKGFLWSQGLADEEDMKMAKKIVKIYGDRTMDALSKNPYMLVRFYSWRRVDKWGLQLMSKEDPRRQIGMVDAAIKDELSKGNTASEVENFSRRLREGLGSNSLVPACLSEAQKQKRITIAGDTVHFFGAHALERGIQSSIKDMLGAGHVCKRADVEQMLDEYNSFQKFPLSTEQREAVANAAINQFHTIAGYAGTGKSTTLNALVYVLKKTGRHIEMAALSGKAALRMAQSAGMHAKTIFRFLNQVKKSRHLKETNLPIAENLSKVNHKTTIILDEASMIDLGNMANIFRYSNENTQIILLGDDFQLPPISFGLVFHSLVKRDDITSKLTKVYRQKDDSNIPVVGEEIRQGRIPSLLPYAGLKQGIHFLETSGTVDPQEIKRVCDELGGFDVEKSNLQIIAPTNRSVDTINAFMHNIHATTKGTQVVVDGFLGNKFVQGDPIVFNRNDYKKNLFNGLIGYVVATRLFSGNIKHLIVRFGDEDVEFTGGPEIGDLSLSYCLTCHKLQGSQAKQVVVVLENSSLVDPTWLYTAITRATSQVVIIGSKEQYRKIFDRSPAYQRRKVGI